MAMIQQPFALDQFFEEMIDGGISKDKSRQQWFGKKSDEATLFAAEEAEKARKKLEKAKGSTPSWLKTLIPMAVNAIIPGSGYLLGGLMSGLDSLQRQKIYKNRLKDVEKMSEKASSKYAGTFLEDYVTNALSGIKSETKAGLKGLKQADLMTGLAETGLSLLPGLGNYGNVSKEAGKEVGKGSLLKGSENLFKNLLNIPGEAIDIVKNPLWAPKGAGITVGEEGSNILANLVASASTPAAYAPLLQEPALNWLTGDDRESTIVRAQNPYQRYRV